MCSRGCYGQEVRVEKEVQDLPIDDFNCSWTECAGETTKQLPIPVPNHEDGWRFQHRSPGMIKRLYAENFLAHPQLYIDFGRNINVICEEGPLSTVFTAIQVALGANASHLGGVQHLQELVRTPPEEHIHVGRGVLARVCITLENGGDRGYQRDNYGDEIHIERTISSRGGCYGFKLLDIDGNEQSRSKSELVKMLHHLNIGIDNSTAFLKQASVPQRLAQPRQLYRFFATASKLNLIEETYVQAENEIGRYQAMRDNLIEALKEKKETAEFLKANWEQERDNLFSSLVAPHQVDKRAPVDVKGAYHEALHMVDSVRQNYNRLKELQESKSELCVNYLKAKVEQEVVQDMINVINQEIERLEATLKARRKRLKKDQKYIVTLASVCFDECLQTMMDSSGKLQIDFGKGELTLVAKQKRRRLKFSGDEIEQASAMDETFRAMAFLLSIAEPLGYPIQCSLFHPANCIDLLERTLPCASIFPNRQFIFLLPRTDIPNLMDDDYLKVIRL